MIYSFLVSYQVESELRYSIHSRLFSLIYGKRGIICESVCSEFQELLSMCGGPNEKLRAEYFLKFLKWVMLHVFLISFFICIIYLLTLKKWPPQGSAWLSINPTDEPSYNTKAGFEKQSGVRNRWLLVCPNCNSKHGFYEGRLTDRHVTSCYRAQSTCTDRSLVQTDLRIKAV